MSAALGLGVTLDPQVPTTRVRLPGWSQQLASMGSTPDLSLDVCSTTEIFFAVLVVFVIHHLLLLGHRELDEPAVVRNLDDHFQEAPTGHPHSSRLAWPCQLGDASRVDHESPSIGRIKPNLQILRRRPRIPSKGCAALRRYFFVKLRLHAHLRKVYDVLGAVQQGEVRLDRLVRGGVWLANWGEIHEYAARSALSDRHGGVAKPSVHGAQLPGGSWVGCGHLAAELVVGGAQQVD
mmetsp:Transcript_783/g.1860  ORF Transcript_783/g.1860 Transcript_783/m.1860 type:complete len:236 (+) Transcript_783:2749-3456(+)